jgi:hypothetical protein
MGSPGTNSITKYGSVVRPSDASLEHLRHVLGLVLQCQRLPLAASKRADDVRRVPMPSLDQLQGHALDKSAVS